MSCDNEVRSFEAGLNSNFVNGGYHNELNDACKSEPEDHKLPHLEWTDRIPGDSSRDSVERRGFCKLSSKDSISIDSPKPFSNQSQHSWKKPGNNGSVGSLQDIEQNGILGSFSKLPSVGREVLTSELQGTDICLLSRCSQPYRPPSFYKAMKHSAAQNHDHFCKGTSGCAECLSKERLMDGSWTKGLEENSPTSSCNETPQISSPDNRSIEVPYSSDKSSEMCLTEESSVLSPHVQDHVVEQPSSQCQSVQIHSGVIIDDVEELQGQISEGGRFSALISLEEAEDIDTYFFDELASSDSFRDGQNLEGNMGIIEKKELRKIAANSSKSEGTKIHEDTLVNAMGKTAGDTSDVDLFISSSSYVRPSYRASNSQLSAIAKDWKGIETSAKELHRAYDPRTLGSDCSELRVPQLSHYTKKKSNIVDRRGSCKSGSRFIHWFPDNDNSSSNISSEVSEEGWMVWGATTGNSIKENISGQGKLQEVASTYCQNNNLCKKTNIDVPEIYPDKISCHSQNLPENKLDKTAGNQDLEDDANSELKLPDEDSLLAIDDVYIFEEDEPKPSRGSLSPVSGLNKPQSLSLADPWFYKSEMNYKSSLINPPNSLARVNAPSDFQDPWNICRNDYTPTFAVVPHRSVHLPRKTHKYEPSDDDCPDLDKILSADPSMYHQFFQTPCHNQEPNVLTNALHNYQATAKSMDVGNRGLFAEPRNKSTVCQFLHMQRKLAQLNIEAVEQRVHHIASNFFW